MYGYIIKRTCSLVLKEEKNYIQYSILVHKEIKKRRTKPAKCSNEHEQQTEEREQLPMTAMRTRAASGEVRSGER